MRFTWIALGLVLSSTAFAGNYTKETCGTELTSQQNKKRFDFEHQASFMNDAAWIEFDANGGFKIYDEEGTNHTWELDAAGFVLTYRTLTSGARGYTNYNLDGVPRGTQGGGQYAAATDWTTGLTSILHDLVHMETTVVDQEGPAKKALNCAQSIVINAVARGQERLLESKIR